MAHQIRIYTTPTLSFRVKDRDLTEFDHIYITISDHTGSRVLTKQDEELTATTDGDDTLVSVTLTQAETKIFRPKTHGSVEINCTNSSGSVRPATEIYDVIFADNLLKEIKP